VVHPVVKRAGGAVDAVGGLGAVGQRDAAGERFEVVALEFERHGAAREALGLGAVGELFGQAPDMAVEDVDLGDVVRKVVSLEMLLVLWSRATGLASSPRARW
jgi:hypothetical protein